MPSGASGGSGADDAASRPPRRDPVLLRRGNVVVTRSRAVVVGVAVVLVLLGFALPYLRLTYLDNASELVTAARRLVGAGSLLGGVDPTYLPGYEPSVRRELTLGLNLAAVGPGLQVIGSVVALGGVGALLTEEINRVWWWFLHVAGYPLVLAPVPLLIGTARLQAVDVPLTVYPAWLPGLLAGLLLIVVSWRARGRIDTYGSF